MASSEGPKVPRPEPEPDMPEGTEALVRVSDVVSPVPEDSPCLRANAEITVPEESRNIGGSLKPTVPKGPRPSNFRPDPVPGLQRLDTRF